MTSNAEPRNRKTTPTVRNPLALFAFVLLAGDGPLAAAYILVHDAAQNWVLLISIVLYTFGMAAWFCFLVWFRPQNLYAPQDFSKSTIQNSPYGVNFSVATLKQFRDDIISEIAKISHEKALVIEQPTIRNDTKEGDTMNVERVNEAELTDIYKGVFLRKSSDYLKEIYRQRLSQVSEIEIKSFVRSSFNPDYVAIEELIFEGFCRIERVSVDAEAGTEIIRVFRIPEEK